jgi:hypothetical protein
VSTDYASLLRRDGDEQITVPRRHFTALTILRSLIRSEVLTDRARVEEARAVLDALDVVQEQADAQEENR